MIAALLYRAAAHQRLALGEAVGDEELLLVVQALLVAAAATRNSQGMTRVPWWMSW
jgi:hypothetical protein